MKPSLCETCMHGQKSVGPITVVNKDHMKIVQTGGYSTICNCKNINSISVSDSGMICSEYEKKPDKLKGEPK